MSDKPLIELRALRQFVAVAEELHFGRAAARLSMTQPPLTQAIQALEQRLGLQLFERTRRTVRLLASGAALLDAARRVLADAAALPAAVQAAARGDSRRLRLAFVSSIAYGPLPHWLRSFRATHPGVRLDLREATLDVQMAASVLARSMPASCCMRRMRRLRASSRNGWWTKRCGWPCLKVRRPRAERACALPTCAPCLC